MLNPALAPLDAAYVSSSSSSHGEKLIIRIALSSFLPPSPPSPLPSPMLHTCWGAVISFSFLSLPLSTLFLSLSLSSLFHLSSVAAGADQSWVEAEGDRERRVEREGWRGSFSVFFGGVKERTRWLCDTHTNPCRNMLLYVALRFELLLAQPSWRRVNDKISSNAR